MYCPSCIEKPILEFHSLKLQCRVFTIEVLLCMHGYYDSAGDWTTVGCQLASTDPQIVCECYHLTNFAILVVSSAQLMIL